MRRRDLLLSLAVTALPLAAPPRARAADGEKKKKAGGVTYIPIETLTGATTRPGGRRGVLTLECGLDIPNAGLRARAESIMPRIRAAYLQTVLIYAAGLPPGAAPNADFLAASLQRETDQVLGGPGARLLLGAILVN
ncbi:Tat pathway signal protein [Phenylobacterium sp.]|uniref:Tat pathway signal protein n=1 Tax=Phenylobacterium sp. TaxID=1871053 RepID=UPI002DF66C98|nr:Tat pathway signal protein [Phenylobacterium sp.]